MQQRTYKPRQSQLYRELRHIESRGLSINYAAIEKQILAMNLYPGIEQALLKNRSSAFSKLLANV